MFHAAMFSRTAEYAVRAMAALQQYHDALIGAAALSQSTGIPANYLSKIMHALGRAGLVDSTRGPGGGFRLSKPADRVTAYEIVRLFDDLVGQRRCFLGNKTCSATHACAAHHDWSRVWDNYESFLKKMTLERLAPPPFVPRAHMRQRASRRTNR
ncbi:MAG: Rrf2 family transcriptional regulator [Candidatus Zixiibacteriota bacterium]